MASASDIAQIDQIQENLITYFRLFANLPGITFTEQDVVWSVNTHGEPGNQVLRAQLPSDTVEQRLDQIIEQIQQQTDHIDWLVFPSCRPRDLGQRLAARGLVGGPGGTWMLANLATAPALDLPQRFRIAYVRDPAMLAEWSRVCAAGFGMDTQMYYAAYARHGFDATAFSLHAIGYLDDQPVTSSTLLLAGGLAGIYDISTPPALRGQGFGSAITLEMMHEAYRRGYQHAWIWASEMGKSIYQKLGFIASDLGVREYRLLPRQ